MEGLLHRDGRPDGLSNHGGSSAKVQGSLAGSNHRRRTFQIQEPSISEAEGKRATRLAGLAESNGVVISLSPNCRTAMTSQSPLANCSP
ncbi:hypothetical protein M0657_012286 [Pyricularia oryzae]|nr:hypothetical protein M0657_012286 [Pyricularia oryzae]